MRCAPRRDADDAGLWTGLSASVWASTSGSEGLLRMGSEPRGGLRGPDGQAAPRPGSEKPPPARGTPRHGCLRREPPPRGNPSRGRRRHPTRRVPPAAALPPPLRQQGSGPAWPRGTVRLCSHPCACREPGLSWQRKDAAPGCLPSQDDSRGGGASPGLAAIPCASSSPSRPSVTHAKPGVESGRLWRPARRHRKIETGPRPRARRGDSERVTCVAGASPPIAVVAGLRYGRVGAGIPRDMAVVRRGRFQPGRRQWPRGRPAIAGAGTVRSSRLAAGGESPNVAPPPQGSPDRPRTSAGSRSSRRKGQR